MSERRKWSKAERDAWYKRQRDEDHRLREHMRRCHSDPKPTVSRTLQVSNDYFCAGSIWIRRDNVWSCRKAAPIISWMLSTPLEKVSIELLKRGCRWTWGPVTTGTSPQQAELASNALDKGSKYTAHEKLTEDTLAGVSGKGASPGNRLALSG